VRCCYSVTRARFSFLFCEVKVTRLFLVFAVKKAHERRKVKKYQKNIATKRRHMTRVSAIKRHEKE